jgi:hypothetical protein
MLVFVYLQIWNSDTSGWIASPVYLCDVSGRMAKEFAV